MQHSILCAATALVLCIASGVSANAQQKPLTLNRPASDFKFKPDTRQSLPAATPNRHNMYRERTLGGHEGGFLTFSTDNRPQPKRRDSNFGDASRGMYTNNPTTQSQNFTAQKNKADAAKGKTALSGYAPRRPGGEQLTPTFEPCSFNPRYNCNPAYQSGKSAPQSQGNSAMDRLQGM
jgi:hypothetical protein